MVPDREAGGGGAVVDPPTGGAGARVAAGRRGESFANGEGAGCRRSTGAEARAVGELTFGFGVGAALAAPAREAAAARS